MLLWITYLYVCTNCFVVGYFIGKGWLTKKDRSWLQYIFVFLLSSLAGNLIMIGVIGWQGLSIVYYYLKNETKVGFWLKIHIGEYRNLPAEKANGLIAGGKWKLEYAKAGNLMDDSGWGLFEWQMDLLCKKYDPENKIAPDKYGDWEK